MQENENHNAPKTLTGDKGVKQRRNNTRAGFTGDVAYSIEEACDILNIGKTMIYKELSAGRLKARRCGARRLILASEINRYLLSLPEA